MTSLETSREMELTVHNAENPGLPLHNQGMDSSSKAHFNTTLLPAEGLDLVSKGHSWTPSASV